MKASIPLDQVSVASPCKVSWDAMVGDDRVRICGQCEQHVYNLSEMTAEEAHARVEEREGRMCIRFYKRADGTMMTKDCPDGLRAIKRRIALVGTATAAVVVAGFSLGIFAGGNQRVNPLIRVCNWLLPRALVAPPPPDMVMGEICVPDVVAPPVPQFGIPAREIN